MLKQLLICLLAIVAIVASIAARQGSSFTVARSVDVRATPARIAPLLGALRTPVPLARILHDAPATQPGVTMTPVAGLTRVTWRIHGPLTLRTRLITAFIGMDVLLGSDLEKGLASLKVAAEK